MHVCYLTHVEEIPYFTLQHISFQNEKLTFKAIWSLFLHNWPKANTCPRSHLAHPHVEIGCYRLWHNLFHLQMGGIWTFSGDFMSRVGGSIFLWHLGTKQTGLSENKQTRSHRPQLFAGCFSAPSSITAKCSWPYKWMFPWFVQPIDPEVTLVHTVVRKWKIHSSSGFFCIYSDGRRAVKQFGLQQRCMKVPRVARFCWSAAYRSCHSVNRGSIKKRLLFVHCHVYWSPAVYRTNWVF